MEKRFTLQIVLKRIPTLSFRVQFGRYGGSLKGFHRRVKKYFYITLISFRTKTTNVYSKLKQFILSLGIG
jgi:hypothetical protein